MAKIINCGNVNPASGCGHIIQGETTEEALRLAAVHAQRDHGLRPTAQLMVQVLQHMTST